MNNIYRFLFAALLLPLFSSAQNNYKPGYVINLKGDTIKGSIDYREWETNPYAITFKAINGVSPGKLSARDISFFEVTGFCKYQSYTGPVSMHFVEINRLQYGRDTTSKQDTIFLKVMQKGDLITLYSLEDNIKSRFYMASKENPQPAELIYRIYYNNNSSWSREAKTVYENTWMNQLFQVAENNNKSSDGLRKTIEESEYRLEDVLKIGSLINNVQQEATIEARDHSKIKLFVGAGLNSYLFKPQGTSPFPKQMTSSQSPKLSVGFSIYTNPYNRRWAFRTELTTMSSRFTGSNKYLDGSGAYTYTYKQTDISLIPQMLCNVYNQDNFKLYLGAGLSFNFFGYPENKFTDTNGHQSGNYFELKRSSVSLPLRAGFLINRRFDLALSYSTDNNITYDTYNFHIKQFQVGFNYLFGN